MGKVSYLVHQKYMSSELILDTENTSTINIYQSATSCWNEPGEIGDKFLLMVSPKSLWPNSW